jgi:hypothetical protein
MSDFETAKSDLTAAEKAVVQGVTRAASTYTAPALAAAAAEEAKVGARPWLMGVGVFALAGALSVVVHLLGWW